MSKAIRIFKKFGDDIKKDYEAGDTIEELCEQGKYKEYDGCSYNTMMVVLGMLGFPSTPYFEPQIKAKLAWLEKDKERRTSNASKEERS